jgi:hypothetical protein
VADPASAYSTKPRSCSPLVRPGHVGLAFSGPAQPTAHRLAVALEHRLVARMQGRFIPRLPALAA